MPGRRGFTLIELLMVILVISVLGAIAITAFIDFGRDAKIAVTKERMNLIRTAILGDSRLVSGGRFTKPGYLAHCLEVPSDLTDLINQPGVGACAVEYNPHTQQGWKGPYVSSSDPEIFNDAWGVGFEYSSGTRTLTSCGPDKTCSTSDDLVVSF